MLTEEDQARLSDDTRDFPFVCGCQETPDPISIPPPGTGVNSFHFCCASEGISMAEAFVGDVFTDDSCFKECPIA